MEPKYSMSAYAFVIVVALGLLAARGFPATAGVLAVAIAVLSAMLEVSYRIRREESRTFDHRRALDRVVRRQWIAVGVVGGATAVAIGAAGWAPLAHTAAPAQAVIFGLVVAAPVVYLSAAVDWWWILPKVSGMTGVAPCTNAGGTQFEGTTKVWYAHRVAATGVVTVVLAGVPGYLAGQTGGSGASGAGYTAMGALLAIGYNSFNNGLIVAIRYTFNSRFHVGQAIRVRSKEDRDTVQDAYVVDVSIAGLTYKVHGALTEDERPRFVERGIQMSTEAMAQTDPAESPGPFCPSHEQCRAINWYCFRHPNAHATFVKEGDVVPVRADGSPLYPALAPAATS